MGRRDNKKNRYSKGFRAAEPLHFSEMMPVNIEEEKQKARKLRNSPWWKRKISDGVCHYCCEHFKPSELTMDHLIPLARGGRSEKINLVPCCKECNNKKKYMMPFEWDEYLQQLSEKKS